MSDLPETKRCPYLVAALIPLLGKLPDDVADAGMSCLQDKCAMWRVSDFWNPAKSSMRMDADGKRVIDNVSDHAEYCGLAGKP